MANTEVGSAYVSIIPSMKGFGTKLRSGVKAGVDSSKKLVGGLTKASVAAGAATAAIGKQALDAYSQYEQMSGGVAKLYGNASMSLKEYAASQGKTIDQARSKWEANNKAQQIVMDNAAKAYKTANMSMNDYMDNATQFSASLISSVGGDTVKAAELTDVAMKDMADNVNTFGTAVTDVQNAYKGFSKQNYTMLDNLKLGYGGTKTEMERLIEDASKMKTEQEQLNETVEDGDLTFGNIVKAIDVVQKHQQIYGTTAREAATTIEGSVNTMKAAWDNWLTGLGRDDADMGKLTDRLVDSAGTVLDNVLPRIQKIAGSLWDSLPDLADSALGGNVGKAVRDFQAAAVGAANAVKSAVEPAAAVVAGAADSFSKLSAAEQEGMVKAGLEAAAIGVLGTQAVKTGSAVGSVFTKVGGFKGGLIGLGVTAAAVIGGTLVQEWADYQDKVQAASDATKSLDDIMAGIFGDAEGQQGGTVAALADKAVDYQQKCADLMKTIQTSNSTFATSMEDAAVGAGQLDDYLATIDRLADSPKKLSSAQQAELQNAVDGYNQVTGSTVEITDKVNGKLSENIDKLHEDAAAWEHNAKAQAMSALAQESEKALVSAQMQKKAVDDQTASYEQQYESLQKLYGYKDSQEAVAQGNDKAAQELAGLEGQIKKNDEASRQYQSTIDAERGKISDLKTMVGQESASYENAQKQVKALSAAMNGMGKGTTAKIKATGNTVSGLAEKLQQAGVKASDLKSMGSTSFANLASSTKGNVDKMKAKIEEWNELEAKGKHPKVTASGNVISGSAKKSVEDYNKTKAKSKKASASASGNIANGSAKHTVDRWNATKASSKKSTASASGNIIGGGPAQQVNRYNGILDKMRSGHSTASASGNVIGGGPASQVSDFNSEVERMQSKKVTITTVIENIKNTIENVKKKVTGASGGIFKMASGGIATGPTMLNSNTLIGEAGTEAFFQQGRTATVVPLSNRRYVRPFARAVASEMGAGGGDVYNITINSRDDSASIADAVTNSIKMLRRV